MGWGTQAFQEHAARNLGIPRGQARPVVPEWCYIAPDLAGVGFFAHWSKDNEGV